MLIFQNKIDPILILSEVELELVLRRENIRIPNQKIRNITSGGSSSNASTSGNNKEQTTAEKADEEYRNKLIEVILINGNNILI